MTLHCKDNMVLDHWKDDTGQDLWLRNIENGDSQHSWKVSYPVIRLSILPNSACKLLIMAHRKIPIQRRTVQNLYGSGIQLSFSKASFVLKMSRADHWRLLSSPKLSEKNSRRIMKCSQVHSNSWRLWLVCFPRDAVIIGYLTFPLCWREHGRPHSGIYMKQIWSSWVPGCSYLKVGPWTHYPSYQSSRMFSISWNPNFHRSRILATDFPLNKSQSCSIRLVLQESCKHIRGRLSQENATCRSGEGGTKTWEA